jgi:hypothetical protein
MAAIGAPKSGEALLSSLRHLVNVIDGKRLGTDRIGIVDWDRWLGAFSVAVGGIGDIGPEGAAEAIHKTAVKTVICADWDVLHSPRVGQDPRRARRELALSVVSALEALDDPAGNAALEEMREARSDDPEIVAACARALGE